MVGLGLDKGVGRDGSWLPGSSAWCGAMPNRYNNQEIYIILVNQTVTLTNIDQKVTLYILVISVN